MQEPLYFNALCSWHFLYILEIHKILITDNAVIYQEYFSISILHCTCAKTILLKPNINFVITMGLHKTHQTAFLELP